MIYALYIEQKITIFALYTKHKYKNQINNLTMENELQVIGTPEGYRSLSDLPTFVQPRIRHVRPSR